jgi:hypothetical protein
MIRIISNKDGDYPRYVGDFTTYSPNSYSIVDKGVEVGSIIQIINFDLSQINPTWSGTDTVWAALVDGKLVSASQHLTKVKIVVKERLNY